MKQVLASYCRLGLALFVLQVVVTPHLSKAQEEQQDQQQGQNDDYYCNLYSTISTVCTPRPWQLDGTCEPDRREGFCTDCLDCDPCRQYNYNCNACIAATNNCVWCPEDALCSSVALTQDVWTRLQERSEIGVELQPSCTREEDWRTESCSAGSNNTTTTNIFSDPLYDSMMWLYDQIHVESVWEAGITGKDIRIRVNDVGGVDAKHDEFGGRFDAQSSCDNFQPPPEALEAESSIAEHGTAVASIALGGANNNQCAVGIAPNAILSACTLPPVGNPIIYAQIMSHELQGMDISINSWSLNSCVARQQLRARQRRQLQEQSPTCPFSTDYSTSPCSACDAAVFVSPDFLQQDDTNDMDNCKFAIASYCSTPSLFEHDVEACSDYLFLYAECDYDSRLTPEERDALVVGAEQGRNGKGVIYVMSAGNGYAYGDSTNSQKWTNTRYTISVGAVDKSGVHASYSAVGSSLFISAPGGDLQHLSNNIVAKVGGGCHDISAGTSFSTPVVAGVVALMLEVNPELTWRDVQGILASTSQKVNPEDDSSWITNAAGFHHSYKYGFGVVHAQDAVDAASTWETWPEERFLLSQSDADINLVIPPAETNEGVTTSLAIDSEGQEFTAESVLVFLEMEHPSRGDLSITLTSPQGTQSILHSSPRPENTHLADDSVWQLLTVRSWGEVPDGDWTLTIKDDRAGNLVDTCVDRPWTFVLDVAENAPNGALVTCGSIARSQNCANGQLINEGVASLSDPYGLTPDTACCVCGGGMAPTEESHLVSWSLLVFGRSLTPVEEMEEEEQEEPQEEETSSTSEAPPAPPGTTTSVEDTTTIDETAAVDSAGLSSKHPGMWAGCVVGMMVVQAFFLW